MAEDTEGPSRPARPGGRACDTARSPPCHPRGPAVSPASHVFKPFHIHDKAPINTHYIYIECQVTFAGRAKEQGEKAYTADSGEKMAQKQNDKPV